MSCSLSDGALADQHVCITLLLRRTNLCRPSLPAALTLHPLLLDPPMLLQPLLPLSALAVLGCVARGQPLCAARHTVRAGQRAAVVAVAAVQVVEDCGGYALGAALSLAAAMQGTTLRLEDTFAYLPPCRFSGARSTL